MIRSTVPGLSPVRRPITSGRAGEKLIKRGKILAVLGTGSDVGKSVVVTALCRIFRNEGINVAPFKAQNMSNNSFVTREGGEMGRAQIVQAQAARVEPHVDMNPVLLKPSSQTGAQVVLHGLPLGNTEAKEYFHDTRFLFQKARESLERLRERFDLIIMEGAGSCAEVNLRDRDFVNFEMAHAADAPVLLVGDIDRGGIFAQIVGTLAVLSARDRGRVAGFIINRFRGDPSLFDDGIAYLEKKTGLPVFGLIPYYYHLEIDSEDGLPLEVIIDPPYGPVAGRINIAVIRLPHISNFTDFTPLAREPSVSLHYLSRPRSLHGYDILFLPGSKNVRFDADWLRDTSWGSVISEYAGQGGRIAGICGGYQILGKRILDPHGLEGPSGETEGLALLDIETELQQTKTLTRSRGFFLANHCKVTGYEIHMGTTRGPDTARPGLRFTEQNGREVDLLDGALNREGNIWGAYLHGLFDEPLFRREFLRDLRPDLPPPPGRKDAESIEQFRDRQYDLLAEHFRSHLDWERLRSLV